MIKKLFALGFLFSATMAVAAAAGTATLTGTIVDVATYVTKDHNMDSMSAGHAMAGAHAMGGSMSGDHMMVAPSPAAMSGERAASSAMSGEHAASSSMPSEHANNGMKQECHILGLLANGRLTILTPQMGSSLGEQLCAKLTKTATVSGNVYTQAGVSIFLVDNVH